MSRLRLIAWAAAMLTVIAGCGSAGHGVRSPPSDWPVWGGDAANTHFTASRAITAADVNRLRVAWERSEGPHASGWETFPVVVGDTMYYTTSTDEVFAVSATDGRVRWTFTPQVNFLADPHIFSVDPVNRGVTVAHGHVYEVTDDDQLIALSAATGDRLWDVRVADPVTGASLNAPGVVWRGEIIVGGPAGAAGLRGFLAAYDTATGAQLWRTGVVPPRGRGWMAGGSANGGGDVWMSPVIDPRTGTVYAATGNPSPAFTTAPRAGCDRWTDATVALDARTGRLRWGYSAICGDAWDYDSVQSPMLLDLVMAGRRIRAVADASKAGFVYVLNAMTGRQISRSGPLVRYSEPHRVPSSAGAVVCPGIFGGIEYGPASYSPRTGLLYVGATEACMRYRRAARPGTARSVENADELDGTVVPLPGASGVLTAIDPRTGQVRWRQRLPAPERGGVLSTAGGVVLTGDDDGYLYAFAARTGARLWRFRIGLRFGSAPLAYSVGGREYLAIAAGGSSAVQSEKGLAPVGGRLVVLAL